MATNAPADYFAHGARGVHFYHRQRSRARAREVIAPGNCGVVTTGEHGLLLAESSGSRIAVDEANSGTSKRHIVVPKVHGTLTMDFPDNRRIRWQTFMLR